jgi:tetratricopeptide (TPR) repeat protein
MLALDDVYAEAEAAILAVNPRPARFYEIIADGLADRFRYVEALPLYDKAIEFNEKHWTAYRGRGRAALNHGDDVLGQASLRKAFDNDPLRNNLQTLNLLTLLESYRHFERYESEDGRWRLLIHRSEAHVMRDIYLQHLNDAWDAMVKKYDFEPRTPITVEAFHRHEDFEVRTIGITGLPALGACFGQLITLDSPSARPVGMYNWASTLRHEMDHVFQLQISNGQLPRWLAEGLSVYEEKTTRPEWERHMEDRLFMHYHMDDIPPVSRFNEWFRDGSRIIFAYYLGNVMVEFIDKELGGMGAVRKMLEMFGEKKTPGEVFEACLNMPPEEFDRRFLEYVRDKRIAHLRMVPRIAPQRVEQLYFKYEDGEADVSELVDLALGYVQQGSRIDAETFIGIAGRRGAGELRDSVGARFHYVQAMLARGNEQLSSNERQEQSRRHLESAIARGLEDFNTYMLMAQHAQRANNRELTLHWLNEARRAWPESAQPYSALYQLHQQAGEREQAIEAAENWVRRDENNLAVRLWLIEHVYDPGRNWDRMADMALQAINVAPLESRTHQYKAFALRRLGRYDDAVRHHEFVRRLASGETPEEAARAEANAILDKAVTWLHAGNYENAKEQLERAKRLDPQNPRVGTIEEELKDATEAREEGF